MTPFLNCRVPTVPEIIAVGFGRQLLFFGLGYVFCSDGYVIIKNSKFGNQWEHQVRVFPVGRVEEDYYADADHVKEAVEEP